MQKQRRTWSGVKRRFAPVSSETSLSGGGKQRLHKQHNLILKDSEPKTSYLLLTTNVPHSRSSRLYPLHLPSPVRAAPPLPPPCRSKRVFLLHAMESIRQTLLNAITILTSPRSTPLVQSTTLGTLEQLLAKLALAPAEQQQAAGKRTLLDAFLKEQDGFEYNRTFPSQ